MNSFTHIDLAISIFASVVVVMFLVIFFFRIYMYPHIEIKKKNMEFDLVNKMAWIAVRTARDVFPGDKKGNEKFAFAKRVLLKQIRQSGLIHCLSDDDEVHEACIKAQYVNTKKELG